MVANPVLSKVSILSMFLASTALHEFGLCCGAGWSFQKSGLSCRREGDVAIYGIPYSEHSSFAELRDCVKTLRPRRIIPTVNASTPAAARSLVDRLAHPEFKHLPK